MISSELYCFNYFNLILIICTPTLLARAVEYADCTSTEWSDPLLSPSYPMYHLLVMSGDS